MGNKSINNHFTDEKTKAHGDNMACILSLALKKKKKAEPVLKPVSPWSTLGLLTAIQGSFHLPEPTLGSGTVLVVKEARSFLFLSMVKVADADSEGTRSLSDEHWGGYSCRGC